MIRIAVFTTSSDLSKVEEYFGTKLNQKESKYYMTIPLLRTKTLKLKDFAPTVPNTTIWVNAEKDQHSQLVKDSLSGVSNIKITNYPTKTILNREGLA